MNSCLDLWRRFTGDGVYPHELAFLLDNPLRSLILPAGRLADRLELLPDSQVLEIGPGPGYFSKAVAARIPDGQLTLFDIQREMLLKTRRKLERNGCGNYWLVQGNGAALPFPAGVFDVVFMVTVLGEVGDPEVCMAGAVSVLRPGGLLSVTEQAGDPDAMTQAELERMGAAAGLACAEVIGFRGGFTLNLRKGCG